MPTRSRASLVFDEHYVSQFVFQPDEVVKNSFEIFIKTPEYQAGIEELEAIFEDVKKVFLENEALDDVIASFTELRNAFTITKVRRDREDQQGVQGARHGRQACHDPETSPAAYEKFLHSDDPAGWLTWQSKGKSYLDLSDNCPFCSVPNVDKKTAVHVSEEYESAAVKNMSALRLVIDKLARFFVPERLEQLRKITTSLEELSPEQDQFLAGLRGQVETLLDKFTALKELSFVSLRDEPDVDKALRSLKIELDLLDALNSEDTQGVVGTMNAELDHVAEQINEIKRRVGIQKARVAKSIEQNQDEINEFLTISRLQVLSPDRVQRRLLPDDPGAPGCPWSPGSCRQPSELRRAQRLRARSVHASGPPRHIRTSSSSMIRCRASTRRRSSPSSTSCSTARTASADFTTLLLTHDIEPAIDIVRTATSGQFQAAAPAVHFLREPGRRRWRRSRSSPRTS